MPANGGRGGDGGGKVPILPKGFQEGRHPFLIKVKGRTAGCGIPAITLEEEHWGGGRGTGSFLLDLWDEENSDRPAGKRDRINTGRCLKRKAINISTQWDRGSGFIEGRETGRKK